MAAPTVAYTETSFTEANPDKGTKTSMVLIHGYVFRDNSLQKLTPIRGRKLSHNNSSGIYHLLSFTEANPDKGTKTVLQFCFYNEANMFTEANPDKGTKTSKKTILNFSSIVYRS